MLCNALWVKCYRQGRPRLVKHEASYLFVLALNTFHQVQPLHGPMWLPWTRSTKYSRCMILCDCLEHVPPSTAFAWSYVTALNTFHQVQPLRDSVWLPWTRFTKCNTACNCCGRVRNTASDFSGHIHLGVALRTHRLVWARSVKWSVWNTVRGRSGRRILTPTFIG